MNQRRGVPKTVLLATLLCGLTEGVRIEQVRGRVIMP
jgi:hypothetical protein